MESLVKERRFFPFLRVGHFRFGKTGAQIGFERRPGNVLAGRLEEVLRMGAE